MEINMTEIIKAVLALVSVLITGALLPYLQSKMDSSKFNKLAELVDIFVGAAEQLYSSDQGQEKKRYVVDKLTDAGYRVEEAEIDAMIESAVLSLHAALKGGAA